MVNDKYIYRQFGKKVAQFIFRIKVSQDEQPVQSNDQPDPIKQAIKNYSNEAEDLLETLDSNISDLENIVNKINPNDPKSIADKVVDVTYPNVGTLKRPWLSETFDIYKRARNKIEKFIKFINSLNKAEILKNRNDLALKIKQNLISFPVIVINMPNTYKTRKNVGDALDTIYATQNTILQIKELTDSLLNIIQQNLPEELQQNFPSKTNTETYTITFPTSEEVKDPETIIGYIRILFKALEYLKTNPPTQCKARVLNQLYDNIVKEMNWSASDSSTIHRFLADALTKFGQMPFKDPTSIYSNSPEYPKFRAYISKHWTKFLSVPTIQGILAMIIALLHCNDGVFKLSRNQIILTLRDMHITQAELTSLEKSSLWEYHRANHGS